MIVTGFLGSSDLVLQSENDRRRIGNCQCSHASIRAYGAGMRNYL
jgi:hypothetical protein